MFTIYSRLTLELRLGADGLSDSQLAFVRRHWESHWFP